jgi:hypothetical protein
VQLRTTHKEERFTMATIALRDATNTLQLNGNVVPMTHNTYSTPLSKDQIAQVIARGGSFADGVKPAKVCHAWITRTALSAAAANVMEDDEIVGMVDAPKWSDDASSIGRTLRGYFVADNGAADGLPLDVRFTSDAFEVDACVTLTEHSITRAQSRNGEPTGIIVTRTYGDGSLTISRPNGTTYDLFVRVTPRVVNGRHGYMVRAFVK